MSENSKSNVSSVVSSWASHKLQNKDQNFYKLTEKIYINIDNISHIEVVGEPGDRYGLVFLIRSSSGDRIHLNKEQTDNLLKHLNFGL